MKLKLSILFLILASAFVYFVFKGNSFSFEKKSDSIQKSSLAKEAILKKLYSTELRDYQGKKYSLLENSLGDYQAVIVHLWASWCGPCVGEIPELMEFAKKNPETKFVIISMDERQEDIATFLKSFPEFNSGVYIKIWDGPSQLATFLDADRLPMSIILKKDKTEPQYIRTVVDWKSLVL